MVPSAFADGLYPGSRVSVAFGKRKVFTGIILRIHDEAPSFSDVKPIVSVLDDYPIITQQQLETWKWMASYYLCGLGSIMQAALPAVLKMQSETRIIKLEQEPSGPDPTLKLSDAAFMLYEALDLRKELSLDDCIKIVDKKQVMPLLNELINLELADIVEEFEDRFKPEKEWFVRLEALSDEQLAQAFVDLKRAKKQSELFLYIIQKSRKSNWIPRKELLKEADSNLNLAKALEERGLIKMEQHTIDSLDVQEDEEATLKALNKAQQQALLEIKEGFDAEKPVLLNGVTGSGKTEIYLDLIKEELEAGQDVLYLLPEIGLTTQIIHRLSLVFPDSVLVYHSKYSANERARIWKHLLKEDRSAKLVVGVRSAIFLPLHNPGLIIVDEEHDRSFKQYNPAPRYQARDVSIWLSHAFKIPVLLGTATPSLESHFNASLGKYHEVMLSSRYGDVELPDIQIIDIKEAHTKKQMKAMFSKVLLEEMEEQISRGKQVILFQNRRGFSPFMECKKCAWTPQCNNCDISLTYHKAFDVLRCHYCGYQTKPPNTCEACLSPDLNLQGFGTEKIELELKELMPKWRLSRMDLDTTRGKHAHSKILRNFSSGEVDVLIGTQMVTKGLDFHGVGLVAVLNADNMLNFPDFRAFEHGFQTLVQVSGRSGRSKEKGKVMIQTFQVNHPVIQWARDLNYEAMALNLLKDRKQSHYPPFSRLIEITLKHRNPQTVNQAAVHLVKLLKAEIQQPVLGPAIPGAYRLRNLYQKSILIKLGKGPQLNKDKYQVYNQCRRLETVAEYRSVRVNIDVDPA